MGNSKQHAIIKIDPKIYPLSVIYMTASTFVDKYYVFIEGDPEKQIKVTLKPKPKINCNPKKLTKEFHNGLIQFSAQLTRFVMSANILDEIIDRAFFPSNQTLNAKTSRERKKHAKN
jgi:hypothetical protein